MKLKEVRKSVRVREVSHPFRRGTLTGALDYYDNAYLVPKIRCRFDDGSRRWAYPTDFDVISILAKLGTRGGKVAIAVLIAFLVVGVVLLTTGYLIAGVVCLLVSLTGLVGLIGLAALAANNGLTLGVALECVLEWLWQPRR